MFQYRLFFMFLDLAELPTLFDIHPLWSLDRFNIACFRRRDHFGDPKLPMDEAVTTYIGADAYRADALTAVKLAKDWIGGI